MADIAIVLGNTRPARAEDAWEHLYPEKQPRWLYARVLEPAPEIMPAAAGPDAVVLKATPMGKRIGTSPAGPVVLWVVLTTPAEGKENTFDVWYDGRHVPDVLDVPGIAAARRFRVLPVSGPQDARWRYLAIYEIEAERADAAFAEAAARAGGPRMPNPGMLAPGTAALPFRLLRE
jgi:hypothetical protein